MTVETSDKQFIDTDTTAPSIESGSIGSNGLDASSGQALVNTQITASDAQSGIKNGTLQYQSAAAPDQNLNFYFGNQNIIDGDNNSGTFSKSQILQKNAAGGDYNLNYASIRDEAGNTSSYSGVNLDEWLNSQNLEALSSISVDSANPDTTDPVLQSIQLGDAIQDGASGKFYIPVTIEAKMTSQVFQVDP